ncbi:unnamed protein product [Thlaspi arvense]|uniref:Reverse transcriptase zinc-binding domain-containing protein n=1 Tax=Thlaspi arvense TaxID=13288 RepID=A0AAU9S908_THLAR|nr:unnamed protein product [Thlaspi arvense]
MGYYAALEGRSSENLDKTVDIAKEIKWIPDIWKVKTEPKIQMFLWKAARGALPVGERLEYRKILLDPTCIRCGELEYIAHVFLHYLFAKIVWEIAPFNGSIVPAHDWNFVSGWTQLRQLISYSEVEVLNKAIIDVVEWSAAQPSLIKDPIHKTSQPIGRQSDDTCVFCKTDVAWRIECRTAGLAWIFDGEQISKQI